MSLWIIGVGINVYLEWGISAKMDWHKNELKSEKC